MKNKKKIILIILSTIIILSIILVVCIIRNNTNEIVKLESSDVEVMQYFQNIEVTNTWFEEEESSQILNLVFENNSNGKMTIGDIEITLMDENNNEKGKLYGYIPEIEAKDRYKATIVSNQKFSDIKKIYIENK